MPETLGEHIAIKRKQLKLTQAEAMAKIGVISTSAYRSWALYRVKPQVKYFPKIMQFLGYCPILFPKSEGQKLELMREYCGLSYREVDRTLELSKGYTYRMESANNPPQKLVKQLRHFSRKMIDQMANNSSYKEK